MISLSLNETQALVKAAARGAGFSWGEAVDIAQAVQWLEAHNLPGATWCAEYLTDLARHDPRSRRPLGFAAEISPRDGTLCPLQTGMMISDHAHLFRDSAPIIVRSVTAPGLMLPFLAQVAQICGPIEMTGQGGAVAIGPDGWHGTPENIWSAEIHLSPGADAAANTQRSTRAEITGDARALLQKLAALTHAPATEASRLAGAGAGLSDND